MDNHEKWDESYKRNENYMFYPKEEIVKFLNRYIRKKVGISKFKNICDFSDRYRALDFGCGIGRQAILLREFGIDAYGVDISAEAINMAKELASHHNYEDMESKLTVINSDKIKFDDNYFDLTISAGVLDSMSFNLAKKCIKEINRVTKSWAFLTLTSGDNNSRFREFRGEEVVETEHEKGTIQSYFNWGKVQELVKETSFSIESAHLITDESVVTKFKHSRYYIVLKK